MSNKAINNLDYTGIVTLSQYKNQKKIPIATFHNAGSNTLFNFLSECLVGNYEAAEFLRPTKIMLLKIDTEENKITPASGFINLMTNPEKVVKTSNVAGSTVCYSFMVSRDILESADFNSLGLYADGTTFNEVDNFAAFCDIELNSSELSLSSLLVIDWELNISNNASNYFSDTIN